MGFANWVRRTKVAPEIIAGALDEPDAHDQRASTDREGLE